MGPSPFWQTREKAIWRHLWSTQNEAIPLVVVCWQRIVIGFGKSRHYQTWLECRFSWNENLQRSKNWTAKSTILIENGKVESVFPGVQPKAGPAHKMQSLPVVFERYIVRDISLTYFWKCSLAHWNLIRHFGKARGSFWGNDLYDALVYERKFKHEYLERQINERLLKSKPSIVKLIENKSNLSKLSTFSESSIVKFIENQSQHLSKLTLYHLKK